ncbi:MAG: class I SAM-dependent methyltransferase [Candidatus Hodarchaeota archaeon]
MMNLINVNCDLCDNNNYVLNFRGRDYRFGRKENYNVVKCNNCGLSYVNPRPAPEVINKLYIEDYTAEDNALIIPEMGNKHWKKILERVWHKINGQYIDEIFYNAKGRVLDIGCWNGYLLLPLRKKGCEVYGIETNPKYVDVCQQLGLNVFCGTLKDARFPDQFFDTVIMSQVVEHLASPKETMREIKRILRSEGKVLVFCPNAESYLSKFFGKYWHGWHIPFHFYAFTKKTIQRLAKETGFVEKRIRAVTPDHFFIISLKSYLFGEKNYNKKPLERGKFLDSFFFRAAISPIFRILDLVLFGKGDCLRVVLRKVQN